MNGFLLPASAAALAVGILLGRAGSSLWLLIAALTAAVLGAVLADGKARRACVLLAVVAFGSVIGWSAYHPSVPEAGICRISGIVSDEAVWEDGRVPTRLTAVTLDGKPMPGDAYWSFYADALPENLAPGMRVTFMGRVYIPTDADNPYGFAFREYLLSEGVVYGIYGANDLEITEPDRFSLTAMAAEVRHDLMTALVDVMGERAGGYAAAMLLGSKTLIPENEREAFAETGTAHILAVSGFHVGVLAAIIRFLLGRQSRKLRAAVTVVLLAAYCVLTGGNPPVIRATLLVIIASYGALRQRQVNTLWTLSAAFILMLLINPAQLTSASFQLSFAAVLGIITVEPLLRKCWNPDIPVVTPVWTALRVSLGAQVGVLLPQIFWYHEFPLAGLVLNLLIIPYAGLLIILFWAVLVTLPVQVVCAALAVPASCMTEAMLTAIEWIDATGVGTVWTGTANLLTLTGWCLLMLGCSVVMGKMGRRRMAVLAAGVILMAASLMKLPHMGTEYIQLSVGAADAAVLHDCDTVIVIDTGEDDTLAHYLHAERLSVDMLLITHLHSDHAGGIRALMEEDIPVRVCCLPYAAECADIDRDMQYLLDELRKSGTEIRILSRGDAIELPNGRIDVLWPEEGRVRPGRDANISPLVTRITVCGVSVLSMGDLYGTYENYCAVPADIVKAAHHGDEKSTLGPFLEAVAPEMVIVSGEADTYDARTRERLEGMSVYATYETGTVTITFSDGSYTVRTHQ